MAGLCALALAACGGDDGGGGGTTPPPPTGTPAPGPVPTATATPTPTPPPVASGPLLPAANDSFVRSPAILSQDRAQYGQRTFSAIPTIAVTGNRIWLAWIGDKQVPTGEIAGTYQVLSYSDDGGATWAREYYLLPANPATDRVGDARLWLAPDGRLWVFYFQSGSGETVDGQVGLWLTIIDNPQGAEPQFGPGRWIGDGIAARPFLYNNEWVLTVDYPLAKARRPDRAGQHLYQIDWRAESFRYLTTLPPVAGADFNEPALIQTRDGGVLLHTQHPRGMLERRTPPGRWAWSATAPFTVWPTVRTRSALARSPSGRLVMVQNNHPTLRNNMTIAFSDDDGRTWPHVHIFDPSTAVSYPDIAFAPDGDILVPYDGGRFAGAIFLARINEQSIVAGTPKVQIRRVYQARWP